MGLRPHACPVTCRRVVYQGRSDDSCPIDSFCLSCRMLIKDNPMTPVTSMISYVGLLAPLGGLHVNMFTCYGMSSNLQNEVFPLNLFSTNRTAISQLAYTPIHCNLLWVDLVRHQQPNPALTCHSVCSGCLAESSDFPQQPSFTGILLRVSTSSPFVLLQHLLQTLLSH